MAETLKGGWSRMATTASASTRPSAACRGTSSASQGFAKASILARASVTDKRPAGSAGLAGLALCDTLLLQVPLAAIVARRPAAFFQQGDAFDHHGAV